ncbi:palmitoyltransferase ZDHHC4 isoform X7 [Serinus canaria]|uniref:palmitoyltransferase ZDHHC4 isoform X7 n=1 Tax=Serinus canaria TaxID=9135 RepID=UPI0021CC8E86|nr:palmitoyltransferase ZDHHC4 isoform X7 [Serinus canaria]
MDFLTLFLAYLCSVLALAALLCLCSARKESFLTRSITRASQVLSLVVPRQLQRVTQQALHRLFHTRSCLFVVLHVALQAAVFGEYTWEVFVYCWELQFHLLLLLLPYLLLAGNLGCFLLCSRANPGTVTKSNAASLAKVYAYDGVLFQRGLVCPTCTVEKPARSKHCSVCRTCVHRFDHHCVWVNNCIGAGNAGLFLLYLLSLTATAGAVAAVTAAFLIQVLLLSNVMHGTYLDAQGQEQPVEIPLLVQVSPCCATFGSHSADRNRVLFPQHGDRLQGLGTDCRVWDRLQGLGTDCRAWDRLQGLGQTAGLGTDCRVWDRLQGLGQTAGFGDRLQGLGQTAGLGDRLQGLGTDCRGLGQTAGFGTDCRVLGDRLQGLGQTAGFQLFYT